jgi:hypothetical protein
MKLLVLALLALSAVCADVAPQITHFPVTTADDMPGIEVQFYAPIQPASAYRVHVECVNRANETLKMSRLIDYHGRGTGVVLLSTVFSTGICTVKRVRVDELTPTKEHSATY